MVYYLTTIATLLAVFIMLGLSFNLLMGYSGQFSIAHGAFFGLGAYSSSILTKDYGWDFSVALLGAVFMVAVISLVLGLAARRVSEFFLVIVTLAFQIAAVEALRNLDITGGSAGLVGIPRPSVFGIELTTAWQVATLAWALVALLAVVVWLVARSPFGRVLRSVREDELAARSLGKRTFHAKIYVFAISSGLAAVAGAVFAGQLRFISPAEFGLERSIEVLSLSIIGGLGAYWGPFLGAAVVVLIPQAMSFMDLPNSLVGAINAFAFSLLVLLFLRFRPQGLLGKGRVVGMSLPDGRSGPGQAGPPPAREERQHGEGVSGDALDVDVEDDVPERSGSDDDMLVGLVQQRQEGPHGREAVPRELRCEGLSKRFGGLQAVDDVSFTLQPGLITGLVGPNGAGKTTLFNLISGVLKPDEGEVFFGTENITGWSLTAGANLGIVRSFQEMRLFEGMTSLDNLLVSLTPVADERVVNTIRVGGAMAERERERRQRAEALLAYLGLGGQGETLAVNLSYAEQKLLMVGRLLASPAQCYLLDEPMAGLDATGRDRILRMLRDAVEGGATICLVEHSLEVIRSVCSWVAFLADGKLVTEGPTEEITNDRELAELYFGTSVAEGTAP